MRVILKEKVANLGKVGDQVKVRAGYGRNYLIPQGKAMIANEVNITEFEKNREILEKRAAEVLASAKARAEKLLETVIVIAAQSGEEGKLFGSVGARDIADAVVAAGVDLHKSEVRLPQGPIRMVGEYDINVQLHSEVVGVLKLKVEREKQTSV